MTPAIYNDTSLIWKELTKEATELNEEIKVAKEKKLQTELELHKKLLNYFHVGDYYYYIFNLKRPEFDFVSEDVSKVLGYSAEEMNIEHFLSIIHPEDQPFVVAFEAKMVEFFKTLPAQEILYYKFTYDYRLRKKDGKYVRLLQQIVTIDLDENNIAMRTLGVHTDITYIKDEGRPVLSFIGLNGRPSYVNVANHESSVNDTVPILTKREREILNLLIAGKTSDEISKILFVSKHTVDSHRKNLLSKTNCCNTSILISDAIKKGWV
jgi:DNA-binding CsgD family transcriptional regulator